MKKSLIALMISTSLVGCNDDNNNKTETPVTPDLEVVVGEFGNAMSEAMDNGEVSEETMKVINDVCAKTLCQINAAGEPEVKLAVISRQKSDSEAVYLPASHILKTTSTFQGAEKSIEVSLKSGLFPWNESNTVVAGSVDSPIFDNKIRYSTAEITAANTVTVKSNPNNQIIAATTENGESYYAGVYIGVEDDFAEGTSIEMTPDLRRLMFSQAELFHQQKLDNKPNYAMTPVDPDLINHAPTVETANVTATADTETKLQVKAADKDGDVIQYALENQPTWTQIDQRGVMTLTPGIEHLGNHQINVLVSDGSLGAKAAIGVNVTMEMIPVDPDLVNHAPTIQAASAAVVSGNTSNLQIVASDKNKDDVLEYSLIDAPEWASIDSTGLITMTPDDSAVGSHQFRVSVSDGVFNVDAQVDVQVNIPWTPVDPDFVNHAPVIEPITPFNVWVGQSATVQVIATDKNEDALSYRLSSSQQWASIDSKGLITINAPEAGKHRISVVVSDGSFDVPMAIDFTAANKGVIEQSDLRGARIINVVEGGIVNAQVKEDGKRGWVLHKVISEQPLAMLNLNFNVQSDNTDAYLNYYLKGIDGKNHRANVYFDGSVELFRQENRKYVKIADYASHDDFVVANGSLVFRQDYFDGSFFKSLNVQWASHSGDSSVVAGENFQVHAFHAAERSEVRPVINTDKVTGSTKSVNTDGTVTGTIKGSQDDGKNNAAYVYTSVKSGTVLNDYTMSWDIKQSVTSPDNQAFINIYLLDENGNKVYASILTATDPLMVNIRGQATNISYDTFVKEYGQHKVAVWNEMGANGMVAFGNFVYRSHGSNMDGSGEAITINKYSFTLNR